MLELIPAKLFPRYLEAKRQGLTIKGSDGIYFVSSYQTKPNGFHKVEIRGNEGWCSCPAKLHCTHLALAAYEAGVMVFSGMSDEALDGLYLMRLRILADPAYRNLVVVRYRSRELVKEAA